MVGENIEVVGVRFGSGSSGNKMFILEEYGMNLIKFVEEVYIVYWCGIVFVRDNWKMCFSIEVEVLIVVKFVVIFIVIFVVFK